MRTNIEIDDQLMNEARKLTGLKTKHAIVAEALKLLVMIRKQENVRSLRGRLRWKGNLASLRKERFGTAD